MITKWGKLLVQYGQSFNLGTLSNGHANKGIPITHNGGETVYIGPGDSGCLAFATQLQNSKTATGSSGYRYLAFGDGNAEENEEDYNISGNIITGLSFSSMSTYDKTTDSAVCTYTVKNTSSNSVTIKEIAQFYVIVAFLSSDGTSSATRSFMVWRTRLDTPITLAPSGTFVMAVSSKINLT